MTSVDGSFWQSSGREEVTGANVLVAMFAETESSAVSLLGGVFSLIAQIGTHLHRRPVATPLARNRPPSR
jgi:hypothetical protein